MSTSQERMVSILSHYRMNANEFARSLGYTRTDKIYNITKGRNGISEALARDIQKKYKELSFKWMTEGIGEMLATDGKIKVNLLNTPIPMESAVESPENATNNENIQRMAISFEELMNKYEDMTQQRDYWRNKAAELEYRLAKLEAV